MEARNWNRQFRHRAAAGHDRCMVRQVDSVVGHGRCSLTWRHHPSPNLRRLCGARVPLGRARHGGVVVHARFEARWRVG